GSADWEELERMRDQQNTMNNQQHAKYQIGHPKTLSTISDATHLAKVWANRRAFVCSFYCVAGAGGAECAVAWRQQHDTATSVNCMNRIESLIVKDAAWLLEDHIQVVPTDTFLCLNFPNRDMELNSKQLTEVLADAMDAHHALYRFHILHRDISPNNILINTATGRGLLIDLDMAKDLLDTTEFVGRPEITGTVFYISPALVHSPGRNFDSLESRTRVLGEVFPSLRGDGFEQVSRAKREFLGTYVSVAGCPNLSQAIFRSSKELSDLYAMVKAIDAIAIEVRDQFAVALQNPVYNTDPTRHYQAEKSEDLTEVLDLLSQDIIILEKTNGPLESLRQDLQKCRDSINTHIFPSYNVFIRRWRAASLDPPSVCIPYIAPRNLLYIDPLIGVMKPTQKPSHDPLTESPTKNRHKKRKSTLQDISASEQK
ncbi:16743_t:CDS:2, partial [Acaulospora colombiana]